MNKKEDSESIYAQPSTSGSQITRNVLWSGPLKLKRHQVQLQLTYIFGRKVLADDWLVPRRRLILNRLSSQRRITSQHKQYTKSCILLAQPYGLNIQEKDHNYFVLGQKIIPYLEKKKATGIVKLHETRKGPYIAHFYAPSAETKKLLMHLAPNYFFSLGKKPYLLIFVFGNKHGSKVVQQVENIVRYSSSSSRS